MAKSTTRTSRNLPGDWRRRRGTSTDVHLWAKRERRPLFSDDYPVCGKRIPRRMTNPATGRPCYDCLAIGAAGRG